MMGWLAGIQHAHCLFWTFESNVVHCLSVLICPYGGWFESTKECILRTFKTRFIVYPCPLWPLLLAKLFMIEWISGPLLADCSSSITAAFSKSPWIGIGRGLWNAFLRSAALSTSTLIMVVGVSILWSCNQFNFHYSWMMKKIPPPSLFWGEFETPPQVSNSPQNSPKKSSGGVFIFIAPKSRLFGGVFLCFFVYGGGVRWGNVFFPGMSLYLWLDLAGSPPCLRCLRHFLYLFSNPGHF